MLENLRFPKFLTFFAPKIVKNFSLSLFAARHKSNFPNIFFAKLINNFHLTKVFFVILAFTRSKGIFFLLICKIKFGQISESIKIDKLGDQCFKNFYTNLVISKGKN